jgi:hypothetical protein
MLEPATADASALRIVASDGELTSAIRDASEEQLLFATFMSVGDLIEIYLTIAALDRRFHLCCSDKGLRRPEVGAA